MKAKIQFLILFGALCLTLGLRAHQPDLSSTILVEQGENNWVLQVRAALTAFEYEVEANYGEGAYTNPEEFQALVADWVRANLAIRFNDGVLTELQKATVSLGHETLVTYQLSAVPAEIQTLLVRNTSFSDIAHNQSALLVLKQGFTKEQFTLNNKNAHTAKLNVTGAQFELVAPAQEHTFGPLFTAILTSLALALIYLLYYKRPSFLEAVPVNN